MLTTAEVNKLFDLLRELHGKEKRRDGRTVAIWAAVLEPWDYGQVRSAAIERARYNRYPPTPAELTAYLPKIQRSTAAGATKPQPTGEADARAKREYAALRRKWKECGGVLNDQPKDEG